MLKRCHRSKTVQGIWSVKNYWTWQFLGMTWGLALEFMILLFLILLYRLKQKVTKTEINSSRFHHGWEISVGTGQPVIASGELFKSSDKWSSSAIYRRYNEWRLKVSPDPVLGCVRFFAAPWVVAHQATLPMEWGTTSYSRGSSWPRDGTHASYIFYFGRWILCHWHQLGSPHLLIEIM